MASTAVLAGGTLTADANLLGITIGSGGVVQGGGLLTGVIVSSGGLLEGTNTSSASVLSGGTQIINQGAIATQVDSGGVVVVSAGGVSSDIQDSGSVTNSSGGLASGTMLGSGGTENVLSGATASGTVVGSGGVELVVAGGAVVDTVVNTGGTLQDDGSLSFSGDPGGSILEVGTITGSGSVVVNSGTVLFAGQDSFTGGLTLSGGTTKLAAGNETATRPVVFMGRAVLQVFGLVAPTGTISGFAPGDTLGLGGVAYDSAGSPQLMAGNVLEFSENGETYDIQFDPAQSFAGEYLHLSGPVPTSITLSNTPCYCPGTAILTVAGEQPVECLAIGDVLVTASGEHRAIRWIGRRSYAGRFLAANPGAQPVRFRAGSLGGGLPRRDLLVFPDHAMLLDQLLIPARCLLNGAGIVQERDTPRVDSIHVELDSHDVLLAEGAPSESFLDDDSRALFHNAAEFAALYPQHRPVAGYCARRVEQGPELEAVRRRLAQVQRLAPAA